MRTSSAALRPLSIAAAAILILGAACGSQGPKAGGPVATATSSPAAARSLEVRSADLLLPFVSTAPANAGEQVKLFVRERMQDADPANKGQRQVVLFVPGCCTSSAPAFDLPFQDYSWMAALAKVGFDVFAMDPTGYGGSPRPKMDDPCNVNPAQQATLVPDPLAAPCPVAHPFRVATSQSDSDEMEAVVNYLRKLKGVERVNLIGWSAGGPTVATYAARNPDKVNRVFLYAPVYNAQGPSDPPPLPQPGFPTSIRTRAQQVAWDGVKCDRQVDPAVQDPIWSATMAADPLGKSWAPPEGIMRIRTSTGWGWNQVVAKQVAAPTLVVVGESDMSVKSMPRDLYGDLGAADKVFVEVSCASHFMLWESQHQVLQRLSAEWFNLGSINGVRHGTLGVDNDGKVTQRD